MARVATRRRRLVPMRSAAGSAGESWTAIVHFRPVVFALRTTAVALETRRRRAPTEARVRTPVVVEAQVRREGCGALGRAGERSPVGPFAQQRLDEALRLAVGAGRVRPGEAVSELPGPADAGETPRAIAAPVVGQHPPDGDAPSPKPAQRILEKRGAGPPALRAPDFDIGHARRVIDRHVHILIADPARPARAVAVDAMADAAKAAQRLDVEVQQIARVRPLVSLDDGRRVELTDAIEPGALRHARHGRARHAEAPTDLPRRRPLLADRHKRRRARQIEPPRLPMRPGRPVLERDIAAAGAAQPLGDRADTQAGRRRGGVGPATGASSGWSWHYDEVSFGRSSRNDGLALQPQCFQSLPNEQRV